MSDSPRWARVQMWRPVREILESAGQLFAEAERLREASEAEPAGAPAGRPPPGPPGPPAAYARRRRDLLDALETRLDPALVEELGLWQKHLAIIALVAFIDERERVALGPLAESWRLPLFQTELVEIDDGGDRFFAQLTELLDRADVHELVFEIHLYCLRAGFVGRLRDRRRDLDRLLGRLVERVRSARPRRHAPAALLEPPSGAAAARRRIGFLGFPLRYYAVAVGTVVTLFVGLRILSNREVARSKVADYCHGRSGDERDPDGAP